MENSILALDFCDKKTWMMGSNMGPLKACPKSLIFCNKDKSSSFISGFLL
jgi:hypothetical protein